MPLAREEAVALFPTGGAIPEELQIGRTAAIDRLTDEAVGGQTVILAEGRHQGKSSVVGAMINRVLRDRADSRLILSVDLRDGVATAADLAAQLLIQGAKQDAGARVSALVVRGKIARGVPARTIDGLTAAATIVGETDAAGAAVRILRMLQPADAPSVRDALTALDARGRATGQRTIIAIDEVQEIARWPDSADVLRELVAVLKREGSTVNLVLTGSERHTLQALYADDDAPLHGLGQRFVLPEIDADTWADGLSRRYDLAGVGVIGEQLHEIAGHAAGHPLRTMLICAHTLDWLTDDGELTAAGVRRAFADAQRHPSWSTA